MISVQEARELISKYCIGAKTGTLLLNEACGCALAETICSSIDTPPFHQSAMDGYAFSFDLWDGKSHLPVAGEIQAGNFFSGELQPGHVLRIFTGAPLPAGADTVVVQEKTIAEGRSIIIKDEKLKKGDNVRQQGSHTKKGERLLQQGHCLSPASVSFLAGTGIEKVKVHAKPVVRIIVTGKELVKPGNPLTPGNIYESNSFGLAAALQQIHIFPASVELSDDKIPDLKSSITKQLHSDILILTGGVSMGDYDLVPTALEECGVKNIFHKVKQKPGKPFYFGTYKQTLVFALPGNPAAVLTCFYEYIAAAISSFTKIEYFKRSMLTLANDYKKKQGLTTFLKGKTKQHTVQILGHQESYMMDSFAYADCLIELEEEKEYFRKGETVPVLMIN
ncbi:MAG: molybdopterin molybdotransferase MoeA [Bacteroidetes bacterium]|nr:molybdopterin molybdotransferase MoeA [Bacteroidota bacterium]